MGKHIPPPPLPPQSGEAEIICLRVADALGVHLDDVLKDVPAKKGGRRK